MMQDSPPPDSAEIKNEINVELRAGFDGDVRIIKPGDTVFLRPILEEWVRDKQSKELLSEEIDKFISAMDKSAEGKNERQYVVAQADKGQLVGVMGLAPVSERLNAYAQTERPVEVINAFVTSNQRGKGVGKVLYSRLESLAIQQGKTEILVTSGPRYQDSGWYFWTGLFGPPITVIKDMWGDGLDSPVWRKQIG